jgi:hypothetical protein
MIMPEKEKEKEIEMNQAIKLMYLGFLGKGSYLANCCIGWLGGLDLKYEFNSSCGRCENHTIICYNGGWSSNEAKSITYHPIYSVGSDKPVEFW